MPLLNHLLTAVAAALMVTAASQHLLHSPALGAVAGALAFAAVVFTRSRHLSAPGKASGATDAPDEDAVPHPALTTRASSARLTLACVTAVLLATMVSICLTASSLMSAIALGALALAVALVVCGLLARVTPKSPSTLVVGGIIVMLIGQLIATGGVGLTRRALAAGLIALAWGLAASGARMLRPTGSGTTVALVGAVTAVVSGLLVRAGNPAAALLLPILLLAPAMISAIWAEIITLAGDRYLGDGKPRRR